MIQGSVKSRHDRSGERNARSAAQAGCPAGPYLSLFTVFFFRHTSFRWPLAARYTLPHPTLPSSRVWSHQGFSPHTILLYYHLNPCHASSFAPTKIVKYLVVRCAPYAYASHNGLRHCSPVLPPLAFEPHSIVENLPATTISLLADGYRGASEERRLQSISIPTLGINCAGCGSVRNFATSHK